MAAAAAAPAVATNSTRTYRFAITSHGALQPGKPTYIPKNVILHTYPVGSTVVCENKIQSHVCLGSVSRLTDTFEGPATIPFDVELSGDTIPVSKGGFYSGLVLCQKPKNQIIAVITYPIFLSDIIIKANDYVKENFENPRTSDGNYRIDIFLLACVASPGGNVVTINSRTGSVVSRKPTPAATVPTMTLEEAFDALRRLFPTAEAAPLIPSGATGAAGAAPFARPHVPLRPEAAPFIPSEAAGEAPLIPSGAAGEAPLIPSGAAGAAPFARPHVPLRPEAAGAAPFIPSGAATGGRSRRATRRKRSRKSKR